MGFDVRHVRSFHDRATENGFGLALGKPGTPQIIILTVFQLADRGESRAVHHPGRLIAVSRLHRIKQIDKLIRIDRGRADIRRIRQVIIGEQAQRLLYAIAGNEGRAFLGAEIFGEGEAQLGLDIDRSIFEELVRDIGIGRDLVHRDFDLPEARFGIAAILGLADPLRVGDAGAPGKDHRAGRGRTDAGRRSNRREFDQVAQHLRHEIVGCEVPAGGVIRDAQRLPLDIGERLGTAPGEGNEGLALDLVVVIVGIAAAGPVEDRLKPIGARLLRLELRLEAGHLALESRRQIGNGLFHIRAGILTGRFLGFQSGALGFERARVRVLHGRLRLQEGRAGPVERRDQCAGAVFVVMLDAGDRGRRVHREGHDGHLDQIDLFEEAHAFFPVDRVADGAVSDRQAVKRAGLHEGVRLAPQDSFQHQAAFRVQALAILA